MNGSSRRITPALASLALTLAGCASVAIHKVDAQGNAEIIVPSQCTNDLCDFSE